MGNSKVKLADGTVLMDLTNDTVTASSLAHGYTAHGANGDLIVGEFTQEQTDWTETDNTSPSYLKNKPSSYPPSPHTHDDRYYTQQEVDNMLHEHDNMEALNSVTTDRLWEISVSASGGLTFINATNLV